MSEGEAVPNTDRLFIDGAWVTSQGSGSIDVINATSEEVIAQVPDGVAADVDTAVAAAREAFESWSQTSVDDRVKLLTR